MDTLKLANPIQIDGKAVTELTYDTNEITAAMFAEADAKKMRASGAKAGNTAGAAEIDYGLHLYLGFMAIVAVNPKIDITDLERMKGHDVVNIMRLGRGFFSSTLGATSDRNSSGDSSEATDEPLAPQPETSGVDD